MDSFLIFFYILDQCYVPDQEDDLGGFLGAISPELWDDGKPMDRAVLNDWKKKCEKETINNQNIIEKIIEFLESYEKQFGFNFFNTKERLITLNENAIVENAIVKAKKMLKIFSYD